MKKLNKFIIAFTIVISIFYLTFITKYDTYGMMIKLTIVPILFIPCILKRFLKLKISYQLEMAFLIFIFFAQFLGTIVDLYHHINNYDTVMHFLSGFLTSFVAYDILTYYKCESKKNIYFSILFILGFSALIACGWEIIEFIGDNLFGRDAQNVLTTGVTDTMKDMIVALLATCLFCNIYAFKKNKKLESVK